METAAPAAALKVALAGRCCDPAAAAAAAMAAAATPAAAVGEVAPLSPAVAQALQRTREKTTLWLAAELDLLQRLLYKVSDPWDRLHHHQQHRQQLLLQQSLARSLSVVYPSTAVLLLLL